MSFEETTINPKFLPILAKQGIKTPTPVQDQAIPVGLEGRDVLAIAQTGTGKTLAFALPALTRLANSKHGGTRMLVLAPTRELARQVESGIEPFARALGLRTACVYGGTGMFPQTKALRQGCDIIVATPGRLLDHMERGYVRFGRIEVLVLDEADRMLDMGFLPDIRRILSTLPKERQTMMFSATFPSAINNLAREFQRDAHRIEIRSKTNAAETVNQQIYTVDAGRKNELLTTLLRKPEVESAIVFIRTKYRTDRVAKQLNKDGINAQAIHGGRSQSQRERSLDAFRRGKVKVLVATDVAARGIDVPGVTHVFNFDIPKTFDDYVHRIGRTGRAEMTGEALTLVSTQDIRELGDIERGLGKSLIRAEWEGSVHVPSLFSEKGQGQKRRFGQKRPGQGGKSRRRYATNR